MEKTFLPFVSVIIPNYNHARYLDARIQTVLNQSYGNFELIILDDKSTDYSLEIIHKYEADPHVSQIVVNEENSGSPFVQWQKGFQLAKGDLIWIAESDDTSEPQFLERLVKEFSDDELSYAFCRSRLLTEEGEKKHVLQGMFPNDLHLEGSFFIKNYLIWGCLVYNASSVVFRKEFALSVSPLYTTFRAAGDWLFWIEMAEKGNVAIVENALNNYRAFGDNTTSRTRLNGIADVEDKKIFDFLKDQGYISSINELRIRKKYVKSIRYDNKYKDKTVREMSLNLWNPGLLVRFLSGCSHLLKNLR